MPAFQSDLNIHETIKQLNITVHMYRGTSLKDFTKI